MTTTARSTNTALVRYFSAADAPFSGRLGLMPLLTDEMLGRIATEAVAETEAGDPTLLVSLVVPDEDEEAGASLHATATLAAVEDVDFDHYPMRRARLPVGDALEPYIGFVTGLAAQLEAGRTVIVQGATGDRRCALLALSVLLAGGLPLHRARRVVDEAAPEAIDDEASQFGAHLADHFGACRPRLGDVMIDALTADGWKFKTSSHEDHVRLQFTAGGETGRFFVSLVARDELRLANVIVRLPIRVPTGRRHAVAGLVAHMNYLRCLGAFELDLRDGDLVFRSDLQVVDGQLGQEAVTKTLGASLAACDDALPLVARVAFADEAPESALGLEV